MYVPDRDKTYLWNKRYIKLNTKLEYEAEENRDCLALVVQSERKQLNSIINQSKTHTKLAPREKAVRFHELALVENMPVISKTEDGCVKPFHLIISLEWVQEDVSYGISYQGC